ncbi:FAD-dependent monooxygenase [Thermomonospora amylolytica]|uniref:FAD-dependent monooxygenase n=1 Tax=Thermomonospora amylolytica TaxID=1411117 RepID=UPI0013006915|nr:FAD-dependent monooxygenase [Thermomonospora amylolytica]
MPALGGHAVVMGAGMAGLLTARALAESYENVTVVERDRPTAPEQERRGVPQGKHAHLLLVRGKQVLEQMFPGITDELVANGAASFPVLERFRSQLVGREVRRGHVGEFVSMTRPFLEGHIRRRVEARGGVMLLDGHDVVGLAVHGGRVTGVRVNDGAGERVLDADLVVDAMGRGARSPAWLARLGHPAPPTDELHVDIGYASRLVRAPEDALGADKGMLIGPKPGLSRAMAMFKVEGDSRWLLTLVGYAGHPPTDEEGFMEFARTVVPDETFAVLKESEPLSEIRRFRFPTSRRRRYEKLRSFPEGLLVAGDAICSFNPIYGQGMSVAALQAAALRRTLRDGEHDLARRYFRAVARVVAPVWRLAVQADLAIPEIQAPRPLSFRITDAYIRRVQRAVSLDEAAAARFFRVTSLVEPPGSLLRPSMAWRALRPRHSAAEAVRP